MDDDGAYLGLKWGERSYWAYTDCGSTPSLISRVEAEKFEIPIIPTDQRFVTANKELLTIHGTMRLPSTIFTRSGKHDFL